MQTVTIVTTRPRPPSHRAINTLLVKPHRVACEPPHRHELFSVNVAVRVGISRRHHRLALSTVPREVATRSSSFSEVVTELPPLARMAKFSLIDSIKLRAHAFVCAICGNTSKATGHHAHVRMKEIGRAGNA